MQPEAEGEVRRRGTVQPELMRILDCLGVAVHSLLVDENECSGRELHAPGDCGFWYPVLGVVARW
jgi:hypothetical protein